MIFQMEGQILILVQIFHSHSDNTACGTGYNSDEDNANLDDDLAVAMDNLQNDPCTND